MDAFYGELRLFPYTFVPSGWLPCDGRQLQIANYQALFAVIGNAFGGSPQTGTFNLPDMRARALVGAGQDPTDVFDPPYNNAGGTNQVTLTSTNMPPHTHTLAGAAIAITGRVDTPAGNIPCQMTYKPTSGQNIAALPYLANETTPVYLATGTLSPYVAAAGAHENRQPYLACWWFICSDNAVFPVRPN